MHSIPLSHVIDFARESARDAAELADAIDGGDPDRLARVADRLAEEYGELAVMLRGQPPVPPAV